MVTLTFSDDEALVLFEWVSRFNETEPPHPFEHQAEQVVLWHVEGMLEATLVAPLMPEYAELLAAARDAVRHPTG